MARISPPEKRLHPLDNNHSQTTERLNRAVKILHALSKRF